MRTTKSTQRGPQSSQSIPQAPQKRPKSAQLGSKSDEKQAKSGPEQLNHDEQRQNSHPTSVKTSEKCTSKVSQSNFLQNARNSLQKLPNNKS